MSSDNPVIYHNPNCSKSRETLQLLTQHNITPTIIDYLRQPPTTQEMQKIITLLGIPARDLLRPSEPEFDAAGLADENLSSAEVLAKICAYPALLQRPIVIANGKAIIARPPAKVLEIIA